MKQKKIPMRKSLVSGEQFPKKQLLRVVYTKAGEISIDPNGKANGRGAYIALQNREAQMAKKKRVFDRAFSAKIAAAGYEDTVMITVTNTMNFLDVVALAAHQEVQAGDQLLAVF